MTKRAYFTDGDISQANRIDSDFLNKLIDLAWSAVGDGTNTPTTPAEVLSNLGLTPPTGAGLIGYKASGIGLSSTTVEAQLQKAEFFDTIAALRLWDAPTSSVTAFVRGYYAAGDGGGGLYYWAATDATTDNGGTVIMPTGHVGNGRWNLEPGAAVNLRQFGAKGDNTQDDTAFIQAALTAVAGNTKYGATIRAPAGTYKITATIHLPSKIAIKGDGMYGTPLSGWTCPTVFSLQAASTALFDTTDGYFDSCYIDGIGLIGDYVSYAGQSGFNFQDSARTATLACSLEVRNSLIKWMDVGLFAGYKYQSIVLNNVAFISCKTYSIHYQSTDSWFYELWLGNSSEGAHTTNAVIHLLLDSDGTHWGGFNTFIGGGFFGASTAVVKIVQQNANAFHAINFQLAEGTSVFVGDGVAAVTDNGFHGCWFNENNTAAGASVYEMDIADLATGTKVIGCTFGVSNGTGSKPTGPIRLSDTSKGNAIVGNVFNTDFYTTATPVARTTTAHDFDWDTIRGNTINAAALNVEYGAAEAQPQYIASGAIAIAPGAAIINGGAGSLSMTLKDPTIVNRPLTLFNAGSTSSTVTAATGNAFRDSAGNSHTTATFAAGGYMQLVSYSSTQWQVLNTIGITFS